MNGSLVEKLEGANGMFETVQNYDCVFMSETWTNESSNVDMNGFVSFCKHRKRKKNSEERFRGASSVFQRRCCEGGSRNKMEL